MQYIISYKLPMGLRYYQNHNDAIGKPDDILKYREPFLWSTLEETVAKRFHSFTSAYFTAKYLMALFPDVIASFTIVKPTQEIIKTTEQDRYDTLASIHKSLFGNTKRVDHILDWTALGSSRHPRNKTRMSKKIKGAKAPNKTYF